MMNAQTQSAFRVLVSDEVRLRTILCLRNRFQSNGNEGLRSHFIDWLEQEVDDIHFYSLLPDIEYDLPIPVLRQREKMLRRASSKAA